MILLKRDRTLIPAAFCDKERVAKELELLRAKRDGTLKEYFKSSLWKAAKPHLKTETNLGKCAYCEFPTDVVAYGDVEHFRPKSIWWWLACCYDNYLFACHICNEAWKGDRFPLGSGGRPIGEPIIDGTDSDTKLTSLAGSLAPDPVAVATGRTITQYQADCKEEKPLLFDPYLENPATFIIYEADPALREVRVLPRKAEYHDRIMACEKVLGINRERLCRERWKRYEVIEKAWQAWRKVGNASRSELTEILAFMIRDEESFAGMARYYIHEVWKVPGV